MATSKEVQFQQDIITALDVDGWLITSGVGQ